MGASRLNPMPGHKGKGGCTCKGAMALNPLCKCVRKTNG